MIQHELAIPEPGIQGSDWLCVLANNSCPSAAFGVFCTPSQIGQPQDYTQRGDPLEDAFTSVEKAVADAQKKVNGN